MHIAAGFGSLKVIRALAKAGASLEAENAKKLTPLQMAASIPEPGAVKLLEALLAGESGEGICDEEDDEGEEAADAPKDPVAEATEGVAQASVDREAE